MRAVIFDLDGTLVDSVYAHVFAWQPRSGGLAVAAGMSPRRKAGGPRISVRLLI